ncbi:DUF4232 domain-containing protein [Streptomyces sp.]|uniref:DUF4232 domain-containing protein n=1 Tax=Streptomyces sp. TaxID=1931 RepID=UPI002810AA04|nr:DUF4232 domain-containing protein [Streptomyces sp.]
MSARTARTRLFAVSTVALAALALTACEGGSDTGADSPASSTTATATATAEAKPSTGDSAGTAGGTGTDGTGAQGDKGSSSGSSGTGTGKGTPAGTGGSKENGTGTGTGKQEDGIPGECSASDVRITAAKVKRPLNHLLLTATNTGSKTCYLPPYPQARFGEAQSVPPVFEETHPQAPTTLKPGKSGYAGVLLSAGDGSAENGHTVNTLTVPFDDGSIATVSLPSDGVHVDDALKVTYWQTSVDHALFY